MKLINSGLEFKGTHGGLSWDLDTGNVAIKAGGVYIASLYSEGEDVGQASPDHVYRNAYLLQEAKDMAVLLDESLGCLHKHKKGLTALSLLEDTSKELEKVTKLTAKIMVTLTAVCNQQ